MSVVPPLLDDDGYAEGRAGNPGNSRCSITKACDGLETMIRAKTEANVYTVAVVSGT